MIEMAFRAYDPCFGCATHTLPEQMPIELCIYDADGNLINQKIWILDISYLRTL